MIARRFVPWRAAHVAGTAVLSHFALDVLTHVPEIPVAGEESAKLGLSLWNHMSIALTLEALMVIVATSGFTGELALRSCWGLSGP